MESRDERERQILEIRLYNYRRNRDACSEKHHWMFDALIRQTERELLTLDVQHTPGQAAQGGQTWPYPFDPAVPWQCPSHL